MTLARGKRSRNDGAAKEGKPQQFHFRNRYIMATETQAGAPRPHPDQLARLPDPADRRLLLCAQS